MFESDRKLLQRLRDAAYGEARTVDEKLQMLKDRGIEPDAYVRDNTGIALVLRIGEMIQPESREPGKNKDVRVEILREGTDEHGKLRYRKSRVRWDNALTFEVIGSLEDVQ